LVPTPYKDHRPDNEDDPERNASRRDPPRKRLRCEKLAKHHRASGNIRHFPNGFCEQSPLLLLQY
jgi:hypothetical protein